MKKLLLPAVLLPFMVLVLLAFTYDNDPLTTLLANLDKLTREYPQEKVHLHLDKPYYSLGEDIWLKGYVVNADHNQLSDLSKILYVDIVNDRDSIKKTLQLPVINGMASGNIPLSDSLLAAGNYHIYAYTKWMANYGSEYFFKKDVSISNALHGAVSASLQYQSTTTNNGKQLTAEITYRNESGSPVSNQPVSYSLIVNGKTLQSDKATTDATGKITIKGLIKSEFKDANIFINTNLRTDIGRIFTEELVIKPMSAVADVQFFPEGGQLVAGIRTKVGFKALLPTGTGENISGYIADEKDEHVAEFRSEHAGMGAFALQPLADKIYTAVVTHQDGSTKRYPLPKAATNGYVMNVNHTGTDSLSVRVSASNELLTGKEAALVAQCNGVVQFAAKIRLDRPSNLSRISIKKMPTGIVQFTLFSPDMAPVAERLIFVEHNDQLRADIKPDKSTYDKRGKVTMDIKVTDALGEPVTGSFSVAVTDQDKVKSDEDIEPTIMSDLLLSSDIKGYIEQPNYYFNTRNTDRLKHLDQLLLTQGWRRFNWTDVYNGKFPVIRYTPEKSLTVSGTITTLGNKPIPNGKVTLFASTAHGPILIDTVADENGYYIFNDLEFTDSTKLIVRATNAKDRTTVKVSIDKNRHVQINTPFDAVSTVVDMSMADYLKFTQQRFSELSKFGLMKNAIALKEVKIVSKKSYFEQHTIPHSASLNPGNADIVIKEDKLDRQTTLINVFYNLPGIEVINGYVYNVSRGISIKPNVGQSMEIIIDGVPIAKELVPMVFAGTAPSDVLGIELLKAGYNTAVYGNEGAKGVIIITTRRGDERKIIDNSFNKAHATPQGYTSAKEFYSPVYDGSSDQAKMADLRSTIFWKPDIITNSEGKASLSFYNADNTGTYKVTLEGLDVKGKLARQTITYAVK